MKKIKVLIIIVLILILICSIFMVIFKDKIFTTEEYEEHEFLLDTEYKYIIEHDYSWSEVADGGSYTKVYYEIDLLNKTIEKREDDVCKDVSLSERERKKNTYYGKLLASGTLNDSQVEELEKLFISRIEEGSYVVEVEESGTSAKVAVSIISSRLCYIYSKDAENIKMSEEETNEFLEIISSSIEE